MIQRDETVITPFSWQIIEAEVQDDKVVVTQIMISGNQTVNLLTQSQENHFCMVFELWIFNSITAKYEYGWNFRGEDRAASVYIWFNLLVS
jgi:hypothetical protein